MTIFSHEPAAERLNVEDEAARSWQCDGCGKWNPNDEPECGECGPAVCSGCGDALCSSDAADEIDDDGRPL